MKKTYLFFISILFSFSVIEAQNLVLNPSFEDYTVCPDSIGKIYLAIYWDTARNSPDYFNACCLDTFPTGQWIAGVPRNWAGYKTAASGNAYAGFIAKWQTTEEREMISGQLSYSLQIGIKYYVSFKVALAGQANPFNYCGINKLGILFSTFPYSGTNPVSLSCNCAQMHSDIMVTDTLNWTTLTGSFISDSNYLYLNIGRLFDNASIDSIQVAGSGCNTYYYLDDVCVSNDSLTCFSGVGINEISDAPSQIQITPNPFHTTFTLHSPSSLLNTSITIYNSLGAIVHRQIITATEQQIDLDVAEGVYFLEAGGAVKKLVVY